MPASFILRASSPHGLAGHWQAWPRGARREGERLPVFFVCGDLSLISPKDDDRNGASLVSASCIGLSAQRYSCSFASIGLRQDWY